MAETSSDRDVLLNELADDFAARYRRGERPSLTEYTSQHPDLADEIRELFPALVEMEVVKAAAEAPGTEPEIGLPPLEHFGDFQILREIGRGGMGVVYESEQISLGRRVALKLLTQRMLRDGVQKRRFDREAKAAARLHHTNIVPVFGSGEHEGTPYYVMQFIQGLGLDVVSEEIARLDGWPTAQTDRKDVSNVTQSLINGAFQSTADPERSSDSHSRAVENTSGIAMSMTQPGSSATGSDRHHRKLSYWQGVARIGVQVADALEYAHRQGIVHRDVKPSNLLLDLSGTAWITDFGLAKGDDQDNLTRTGDMLGTLRYMPPEAFEGKSGVRGDVYGLGISLYELLALRPAFDERDRNKLIKAVTTNEPSRLRRVRANIPRDLETIVHKAIDREPGRRYGSAAEMAADLQRFLDDEPIKAREISTGERVWRWCRHYPAIASLIGLVALLMAGITVASLVAAVHFDKLARAADLARVETETARTVEQKAKEDARQKLVRMHLTTANLYADRGDHAAALHWVAKAWIDDQSHLAADSKLDLDVLENHRTRVGDALEELPQLIGACFHGRPVLDGDFDPTGRLAATHVGDHRVFLWDWARGELAVPALEHTGQVAAIAFSPDGRRLATAATDQVARVWDTANGQIIQTMRHDGPVTWVAFSPDGTTLATTSGDQVRLWDSITGAAQGEPLAAGAGVDFVRFCPDGSKFVSAAPAQAIVWDAFTGKPLGVTLPQRRIEFADRSNLMADPDCVQLERRRHRPVFSADSRLLVTSCGHELLLWSAEGIRKYATPNAPDQPTQIEATFVADGRTIVYGWRVNSYLHFIDVKSGAHTSTSNRLPRQTGGVRVSPNGRLTAIPITSGNIFVSPLTGPLRNQDPLPNSQSVTQFNFDQTGRRLWATSLDGLLRVWQVVRQSERYDFDCGRAHCLQFPQRAYTPDGRVVAEVTPEGVRLRARLFDAIPPRVLPQTGVRSVRFGPEGKVLVSWGPTGTRVWQMPDGVDITPSGLRLLENQAVAFDAAATRIATLAPNGALAVWEIASGRCLFASPRRGPSSRFVLLDESGDEVVVTEEEDVIRGWDVATGKPRPVIDLHKSAYVTGAAFGGPTGQFVTTSSDLTVRQWDRVTHQPAGPTFRNTSNLSTAGASYSPDGHRLAYSDEFSYLHLVDAGTGEPLASRNFRRFFTIRQSVHFSADGRRVITHPDGSDELQHWVLPRFDGPPEQLPALVRFLTGFVLDNTEGLTPIDTGEWLNNPEPYRAAWRAWRVTNQTVARQRDRAERLRLELAELAPRRNPRTARIVGSAEWVVSDQELSCRTRATQFFALVLPVQLPSEFNLQFEARRDEGAEAFIVYPRWRRQKDWVWFNAGRAGNTAHGFGQCTEGEYRDLASAPGTVDRGSWHQVQVTVRGDTGELKIDDRLILSVTSSALRTGSVAFGAWNTRNSFRNIRITDSVGNVLFDGLPTLPTAEEHRLAERIDWLREELGLPPE
jgi:serine/threonine protein kinase/WD40 repeat protein